MNRNTKRELMLRCIASELQQPIPGFQKLSQREILEAVGNRRLQGGSAPAAPRGLFDEAYAGQTDLMDYLMNGDR